MRIMPNEPIRVSDCGEYTTKEGKTAYWIRCMYKDNLPETYQYESFATDYAAFFLDSMPEGVVPGSYIICDTIVGIEPIRQRCRDEKGNKIYDKYGQAKYNYMWVVTATGITKYPPTEESKPKRSKKSQ